MIENALKGKKVVVMGLGRFGGGLDSAEFAAKKGAGVLVTDLASADQLAESVRRLQKSCVGCDIELRLGEHRESDFGQADLVIANPAIAPDNKFIQHARNHGAAITSRVALFFELCPAPIVGITGSNGKSTTTALTGHILRAGSGGDYRNVWVGGNIGNEALLTIAERITSDDVVVLELSSFQIEQLAQAGKAPKIALLTNLTPDHLDRYGTFERYCAAKEHLFRLQQPEASNPAVSIFNGEDEIAAGWFTKYDGEPGRKCIKYSAADVNSRIRQNYRLVGTANLSNLAAAVAIVSQMGVTDETIAACLRRFRGLSHRLEFVEEVHGVHWYNDSKATTPLSAIAALEGFDEPVIIIAGGSDKNIGFEEFGRKISQKAKCAILIGQTADKIAEAIQCGGRTDIHRAESLEEAVITAKRLATRGEVVLMSPACASFDMFENYERRGELFCTLVRQMK